MKTLFSFVLSLALFGCSQRTEYIMPIVNYPEEWTLKNYSNETNSEWWKGFNNDELNVLVNNVLEANPELSTIIYTLKNSVSEYELAKGELRPDITASIGAQSNRSLKHSDTGKFGGGSSLGLSYTVDLWGAISAQQDIALFTLNASQEDFRALRNELINRTLNSYWELAYLQKLLHESKRQYDILVKRSELIRLQYTLGEVSKLDWLAIKDDIISFDSELSLVDQKIKIEKGFLLRLLGKGHGSLELGFSLSDVFPVPEFALVSQLIQRPDLRAAEWELKKQLANKDLINSSYYPALSLSSGITTSGLSVGDLFKEPVGSLAASLSFPFLEYRKMQQTNMIAENSYQQAIIQFQQAFYEAMVEVDNTINSYSESKRNLVNANRQLELASESEQLFYLRYKVGQDKLADWLQSQNRSSSAEISALGAQKEMLVALSYLYLVLGS